MKIKYVLAAVILVLVATASIYTKLWFDKTDSFRTRLAHEITLLEKDHGIAIKYDSIERKGFPFEAELQLVNPAITSSSWTASHVGRLTIGGSVLEKEKIWIQTDGQTKVALDNQEYTANGNVSLKCGTCGDPSGQALFAEKDWGKWTALVLRDLRIDASNFTVTQGTQDIFKLVTGYLTFKNEEKDGFYHFSTDTEAKGLATYPTAQSLQAYRELMPHIDLEALKKALFNISVHSNFTFAAHGSLPTFDHPFYQNPSLANAPPFAFAIDKSTSNNDFYSGSTSGTLEFKKPSQEEFTGTLQIDNQMQATPKLHPKLVELARVFAMAKAEESPFARLIADNSAELVPNFADFGAIIYKLDGSFAGQEAIKEVDLKDYTLSSSLYGLQLNGHSSQNGPGFTGNFNVLLTHYRELLRDMKNYYGKWQKILVKSEIPEAKDAPLITDRMVELVIQFLASFTEEKDSENLKMALVYNKDEIKIGTKSLPAAMQAFSELAGNLQVEVQKAGPAPISQ